MNDQRAVPWIILLAWNARPRLAGSLGSLADLRGEFEVLVVDNGSRDGTVAEARSILPRARLLENGANLGFAEGNNRGMEYALARGATHLALVNDDMRLDPAWLETLLEDGRRNPRAGIWGGLVLFQDRPETINSSGLVADRWLRARDRDFGRPLRSFTRREPEAVAGVTGGAMLISRAVASGIGLLDASLFAYYEDLDYCLRARSRGFEIRFVPAAISYHQFAASMGATHPRRRFLLARNQMIILGRHAPRGRAPFLLLAAALYRLVVRAPLWILRGHARLCAAEISAAARGLAGGWREWAARGR